MPITPEEALARITAAEISDFAGKPVTLDSTDSFGGGPLEVAAIWGDIPVADALLRGGAAIDQRGEHGFMPLHQAVAQGHFAMVDFLLSHGADPSLVNEFGSTLDLATRNEHAEILAVLKKHLDAES